MIFQNFGNQTALIQENGNTVSYQELKNLADSIVGKMRKRTLVFCLCSNTIESVAAYWGALNNDIVPLLLSQSIDNELLRELVTIYQPEYLWIPEEKAAFFDDIEVLYRGEQYCLCDTGYDSLELDENLALLLTTSGSTGSPKLVRQSYANIKSNTKSIVEYLGIEQQERAITTLPMNYTYGLSIINTHLYVGATVLLTDKALMQKEFWEFFKEKQATSFGGVPYTYEMLDKLRFTRMQLPSLRYMTQAGGKLSPELHKKFAEYARDNRKSFVVMYGQTEATARMAYLPSEKSLEKYGSMGIAIPGGRFELVDADDNIISEPNVVGELVYYGQNVTLGYAECRGDLLKGDERKGRLSTGDMASFDEDGYFYIVGRKKRFLKIFGNRVNLDECEMLLKDKYSGISCACGGRDDKLYIFLTYKDHEIQESVREYLAEKTRLHTSAFEVEILEDIPKNEAGKIIYKDLQSYVN